MAFPTQFALSYELSRLVPVVPIINAASHGLLELVRDFQGSGSNLVTEHDLAEIFGRNYIQPQFATTFKTAVRTSAIHRLAGVAEIVLEAGAGPTVNNAVERAAFLPMVVQLSALLWAHDVQSLASSLARTFELRAADRKKSPPSFSSLVGTLRCIRQQTSGFLWELYYSAVEEILKSELRLSIILDISRPIAHPVLATLIDALPVVQRFPETHVIVIRTYQGITALVIWIHHILGLTVEIQSDHSTYAFGKGDASVLIDCTAYDSLPDAEVILFNEAKDITFRATTNSGDDPILEPTSRQPLQGYCKDYIDYLSDDNSIRQEMVLRFLKPIIEAAERGVEIPRPTNNCVPSKERILLAATILFHPYEISSHRLATFDLESAETRTRIEWVKGKGSTAGLVTMSRDRARDLTVLLFAVWMICNLEECKFVPLRINCFGNYLSQTENLTLQTAFETLATLLLDRAPSKYDIARAAVVSSWGWSLCTSSILHNDPGDLRPDLAIKHGVPSRYKDRKEWITDVTYLGRSYDGCLDVDHQFYTVVGWPGDVLGMKSTIGHSSVKHMIGTTNSAFQLYSVYTCSSDSKAAVSVRVGLRSMQDAYWRTCRVPRCSHGQQMDEKFTVPGGCLVFQGTLHDPKEAIGNRIQEAKSQMSQTAMHSTIHITRSVSNISQRWILLGSTKQLLKSPENPKAPFKACYLQNRGSCLECAVKYIQERETAPKRNVLLIA